MLLAVDIGNTHVVLGLFDGKILKGSWRLRSEVERTSDEYASEIINMISLTIPLRNSGSVIGPGPRWGISAMAIASVVPPLTRVFSKIAQKYFGFEALVVTDSNIPSLEVRTDDPAAVGADRLVNAFAGRELYGSPLVIVDMGTATTFDIVGADGAYEGGVIAPGLKISAQALFSRAAMLPSIQIEHPGRVLGKNTREAMLSGITFGYVGLVDGLIERIGMEIGVSGSVPVIGTGGLASLVVEDSRYLKTLVPDLTLQGLRLIAENCCMLGV